MNELRAGLPPLPDRLAKCHIDEKGFPVPFFVAWRDTLTGKPTKPGVGKPDHRFSRPDAIVDCVNYRKCWICGDVMGAFMAFSIGGMCLITGVSADPPAHLECAEFAAKACPFLSRPSTIRRKTDLPAERVVAGMMIERNPGVTLIWTTKKYKVIRVDNGERVLFQFGKREHLKFYREGRPATRAEIIESIDTGVPILRKQAEIDGEVPKLIQHIDRAMLIVEECT